MSRYVLVGGHPHRGLSGGLRRDGTIAEWGGTAKDERRFADLLLRAVQRPKAQKKNTINYHLSRLYPMMSGPQKKK